MDWPLFWAIVGVLVAVVGVVVTIFVYRRQAPKRELRYSVEWTPMVNLQARKLEVIYNGALLRRPWFAVLRISSNSRADISSAAFDGDHSILFQFPNGILGAWAAEDHRTVKQVLSSVPSPEWRLVGAEIQLPPQLIRKGSSLAVGVVCDGEPGPVVVVNPLVDMRIADEDAAPAIRGRQTNRVLTVLLTAASVMAVVGVGLLVTVIVINAL